MTTVFLALLGCVRPACEDEACDEPDGTAPSTHLGVACVEAPDKFREVSARLAEVATVGQVSWRTDTAATGQVAFTFGEGDRLTPAVPDTTEHAALLLGIPADTEVRWRAVVTDADGTWCSTEHTLTTSLPPPTLPELTPGELDPDRASGAFVPVSLLAREQRQVYIAILDGAGRYVWWKNQSEFNYRVKLSADKTALLSNTQAVAFDAPGAIIRTDLRGAPVTRVEVVGAHTDFAELPDGTLATLAWELRDYEDGTRHILGDRLVEIAPDGTQTEVWSVFDDLEPDLSQIYESGWDMAGNEDWSHANGLSYDPAEDAYYVTFFQFEAVARVRRATGELDWMLTPQDPSPTGEPFTSPSEPYPVSNPHSARAIDADSLLVLNRGWFAPGECSEVVEMTVDPAGRTVTRDWSWSTEDCLQVVALGDAHRLPNGNTFVAWSFSGQLDEVTPDGDVVWRVNTDLGEAFGFSEPVMSLYAE